MSTLGPKSFSVDLKLDLQFRPKTDEGQICRLTQVTEKAATYEKKVELLFHSLPKKMPLEWVFQIFSRLIF